MYKQKQDPTIQPKFFASLPSRGEQQIYERKQTLPVMTKKLHHSQKSPTRGNQKMSNRKQALPVPPQKSQPFADLLTIGNQKRQLIPVQLPDRVEPMLLPPTLAHAMKLIVKSGARGIDTLSLQRMGICRVDKTMYRLREKGIGIRTTRAPALDENDNVYMGIGYYSLDSELTPATETTAITTPFESIRPSILRRILSKIRGTI